MAIFNTRQLERIVADVLRDNPAIGAHDNAIVGAVDSTGVQVVIAFSKDVARGRWTATAAGRHDWSGENSVGATVIYSW